MSNRNKQDFSREYAIYKCVWKKSGMFDVGNYVPVEMVKRGFYNRNNAFHKATMLNDKRNGNRTIIYREFPVDKVRL